MNKVMVKDCFNQSLSRRAMQPTSTGCRGTILNAYLSYAVTGGDMSMNTLVYYYSSRARIAWFSRSLRTGRLGSRRSESWTKNLSSGCSRQPLLSPLRYHMSHVDTHNAFSKPLKKSVIGRPPTASILFARLEFFTFVQKCTWQKSTW